MPEVKESLVIAEEMIVTKIYFIRGQKVMLDEDLAELYQVETRRLNEQVKRNKDRFPDDFMFQLTENEYESLMSQIAISKRGGRRTLPYAFTEHGVLMLSSVLNSERATKVNIQIMRIYTKMREMFSTNQEILLKLEQLERKVDGHDGDIQVIFDHLKLLIDPPYEPRARIGFRRADEKD